MPEKEGAEEKTTKSVVNKKQKQMMGEEGYDVARDMGRVKPSKDKKDATTMPPSKEMEKTRKVNKGPSALERVKADIEKKYGKGAIMKVGKKKVKEELDLTHVAEAFGGYIVEAEVTGSGTPKKKKGQAKVTFGKGDSIKTTQRSAGTEGRMDSRNPKMGGGASTFDLEPEPGDKRKLDNTTFGGPVKIIKKGVKKPKVTVVQTGVKSPKFKKPEDIKGTAQQFVKDLGTTGEGPTPENKEILKNIKSNQNKGPNQNPEFTKLIGDQRRRQQAYDAFDDSDSGRPETGNTLNNTKNTRTQSPRINRINKNQQTFDQMFKNVRKRKPGEKPVIDDPFGFKEPESKPKSKPEPETKTKTKTKTKTDRRLQRVRIAAKKTARTGVKTAKYLKKNPFATLVGASMAKDTFFPAALPKPPTVQGGKVGRRTAG